MNWSSQWLIDPAKTIWAKDLKKEGSNLIDDEGGLYFECGECQKLFDPKTTSFKTLHDKAKASGWKVVWNMNGQGYKIYCGECQ